MSHFANAGASPGLEEYALRALPDHLSQAGQYTRLCGMLLNFNFMEAKVSRLGPYPLIQDYNLAYSFRQGVDTCIMDGLSLIQKALQLSAHVLQTTPSELPSQLLARLMNQTNETVKGLLSRAAGAITGVWLRPLKSSLVEPGGPLLRTLSGHTNHISATEFMLDSRYCASADYKGNLKLWDVEAGVEVATLQSATDGARAIAITPDGGRIVVPGWNHKISVWDLKERRPIKEFASPPYPDSVAVSADCKYAVSNADRHRTLKVWDVERGQALPSLRGHAGEVTVVRAIPGGDLFISASDDGTCKVWDVAARKLRATLAGHSGAVEAVVVTPDGRYAVSQSTHHAIPQTTRELKVWDLHNFSELTTIPLPPSENLIAAVRRPGGKHLIYTSSRGVVNVLELDTGSKVGSISSAGRTFNHAAVSPDGRYLVSASEKDLNIWDASVDAEVRVESFPDVDNFNAVGVTPDGRYALSISDRSNIKSWDLEGEFKAADVINTSKRHSTAIEKLQFKSAPTEAISLIKNMLRSEPSKWRESGLKEPFPFLENIDYLCGLAFTPDAKHAVVASQVGTTLLLNLANPEESKLISARKRDNPNIAGMNASNAVAVTGDGQHLIASYDKDLKVWDVNELAAGKFRARLLKDHYHVVTAVVALPDSRHLISASYDGHLLLWRIDRRTPICFLLAVGTAVTALAVTPQGQELFIGLVDGTVMKWDLARDERQSRRAHRGMVTALRTTRDGRMVLSVSEDTCLKLWDVEHFKPVASFSGDSGLTGGDITPDGLTVIACSASGQLHILRLEGTGLTDASPVEPDRIRSEALLELKALSERIQPAVPAVTVSLGKTRQRKVNTPTFGGIRHVDGPQGLKRYLFGVAKSFPILTLRNLPTQDIVLTSFITDADGLHTPEIGGMPSLAELLKKEFEGGHRDSRFSPVPLSLFRERGVGHDGGQGSIGHTHKGRSIQGVRSKPDGPYKKKGR
jgi:WD40 repeat protein